MAQPVEANAAKEASDMVHFGYRVVLTPGDQRIRAMIRGETIADSSRVLVMHETRLPSVFYFPRNDVDMNLLTRTAHRTHCPFKGDASYWTFNVGGLSGETWPAARSCFKEG